MVWGKVWGRGGDAGLVMGVGDESHRWMVTAAQTGEGRYPGMGVEDGKGTKWLAVQRSWMYLEATCSSEDIIHLLPEPLHPFLCTLSIVPPLPHRSARSWTSGWRCSVPGCIWSPSSAARTSCSSCRWRASASPRLTACGARPRTQPSATRCCLRCVERADETMSPQPSVTCYDMDCLGAHVRSQGRVGMDRADQDGRN